MTSTTPRRGPAKGQKAPAGAGTRLPRWVPVGAGLAVAVVALVALAGGGGPSGDNGSPAGGDRIAHVHGLGINPADGMLFAATHHGLFRVPADGEAERVGTAVQDTMGFTVAGEDHFLASGHPDLADDRLNQPGKPPLLGLVESTDAGRTWEPVSLLGEADFHALKAAHGLVYGYDATSGRLLVSSDGKEWETRVELAMGDFAVDPADADRLVAMTAQGLAESTDGGRTWQTTSGPQLAFLSWHERQGLWGITPTGETFRRGDQGWEPGGALPGPPQALLATGDELYAAVAEGEATGIYVSPDDGRTWEARYSAQ